MNLDLKKILSEANFTPSGDNCQPWKFKIFSDRLEMFNLPEKDQSVYNFRQQATYISCGAFIENINIVASANNLKTQINLFPNGTKNNHVATIIFSEIKTIVDPLFPFIKKRCTNRKPYKVQTLDKTQEDSMLNISIDSFEGGVSLIRQREDINNLANVLSVNEKIVLENFQLHKFLFENIAWNKTQSFQNKDKMFIKTLEMNPIQNFVFKLCKNWSIMKVLNKFRLSDFIAKENGKIYRQSSALGAIIVPGTLASDFILGGRLLQRAWLTSTSLGLSFQPLAGIVLLYQKVLANQTQELSNQHTSMIITAYNKLKATLKTTDRNIIFMFRIGKSDKPSALNLKLPLEKIIVT